MDAFQETAHFPLTLNKKGVRSIYQKLSEIITQSSAGNRSKEKILPSQNRNTFSMTARTMISPLQSFLQDMIREKRGHSETGKIVILMDNAKSPILKRNEKISPTTSSKDGNTRWMTDDANDILKGSNHHDGA